MPCDCVLTTVIWQNLSNKETNPILTRPPNEEHREYRKLVETRPIVSALVQSELDTENSKLQFLYS